VLVRPRSGLGASVGFHCQYRGTFLTSAERRFESIGGQNIDATPAGEAAPQVVPVTQSQKMRQKQRLVLTCSETFETARQQLW
jgi:hypothetical protein